MKKFNKKVVGVFGNVEYKGEVQVGGIIDDLPTLHNNGTIYLNTDLIERAVIDTWNKGKEKVFFIGEENGVTFRNSYERYNYLFSPNLNKPRTDVDTLTNLSQCIDVRSMGLNGFTSYKDYNFEGAVVFGLGKNIMENPEIYKSIDYSHDKCIVEEAHYVFDFTVWRTRNSYVDCIKELDYLQEDYTSFKENLLKTKYSSRDNLEKSFVIFVEGKNKDLLMKNLSRYIRAKKYPNNERTTLVIDRLIEYCNDFYEKIEKIDIYYNPSAIKVKSEKDIESLEYTVNFLPFRNEE